MVPRDTQIKKTSREISIIQSHYLEVLSQKQGTSNYNPLKFPVKVNEKAGKADDKDELADATSYRKLVESLLFLAKQTRLDILYGVNIPSRFMVVPTITHMRGPKRIFGSVHAPSKLKFVSKAKNPVLMGESDADWSGNQNDQKSTTVFFSNIASTVVLSHSWLESNRQSRFQAVCLKASTVFES